MIINNFKLFESHQDIHDLCKKYYIENYTINDGLVSVDGDVDLNNRHLTEIPIPFKEVSGILNCSHNKLTSLKNCPQTVGDNFYCDNNQLTSLEYCPETVGGGFYCGYNQITNFDGLPEFFEQFINLRNNPVNEIYKIFKEDPRCIYWIREYDVIRDMVVNRYRLEEVFHTLEMEVPKDIILKEYILI